MLYNEPDEIPSKDILVPVMLQCLNCGRSGELPCMYVVVLIPEVKA